MSIYGSLVSYTVILFCHRNIILFLICYQYRTLSETPVVSSSVLKSDWELECRGKRMVDEANSPKPIEPPQSDPKREVTRALIEAVAGIHPVTAGLARIYQVAYPPKSEVDEAQWRSDISNRTNENSDKIKRREAIFDPKESISGVAAHLVQSLAINCPDGLGRKLYSMKDYCDLIPGVERQEISDAAYELENLGLLTLTQPLNRLWSARLTAAFYDQLDGQIMGWEPHEDGIALARIMLSDRTGFAPDLHAKTGWGKRRFNPALRSILYLFPEGKISKTINADYVTLSVALDERDFAVLRRFIR